VNLYALHMLISQTIKNLWIPLSIFLPQDF
jgi:hypothetical protein